MNHSEIFNDPTLTLHDVVNVINTGGTPLFSPTEIAAQYAVRAADEQRDLSDDNLYSHLDLLIEAGAEVDYEEVKFDINNILSQE